MITRVQTTDAEVKAGLDRDRSPGKNGPRATIAEMAASAIKIRSPFWVPSQAMTTRLEASAPTMAPMVLAA